MSLRPLPQTRRAPSLRRLALAFSLSVLALAAFGAASASADLYWSGTGGVTINRTTSSGAEETVELVHGVQAPFGVAVYAHHVYWANTATGSIGRANLDGGEVETEFIGGVLALGVAVDSGHLYWTSRATESIGRANLDGGEVETEFIGGPVDPAGLAVDSGHLYWSQQGSSSIGRANLDGGEVETEFIGGTVDPAGVAVDSGHLYWAERSTRSIARANLDGGEVELEFTPLAQAGEEVIEVAVDSGHLYWVNPGTNWIGRAKTDGSEVEAEFRHAGAEEDAYGIAVGHQTADPDSTSLSFGSLLKGSLSASQSVTFTNHGNLDLNVEGLSLGGADPTQFFLETGNCGGVVPPGGSCTAGIRFFPQAAGTFSATLTAQSDAETAPLVSLSGNGTEAPLATLPAPPAPPAPQTSIKSGPPGRSANRKARFVFGSNQQGVTFICRLDKQKFQPCNTKMTFNVGPGHHVLRVKAVGPTGIVDPTAAKRSFVVVAGS